GGDGDAKGDARQEEVAQAFAQGGGVAGGDEGLDRAGERPAVAGGREDAPFDGEGEDQQDPEQKGRHRDAEDRDDRADVVGGAVALEGGDQAEGQRDQDGGDHGEDGQLDGGWQLLRDQGSDGGAKAEGLAEVAAGDAGGVVDDLAQQGIVQAELGA